MAQQVAVQAVAVEPAGLWRRTHVRPVTRPWPIASRRHHVRRDRVAFDIPTQGEQVGITIHQNGLEAALKQMPDHAVAAVVALGLDAVHVPQQARQIGVERVQHEVKVISH